MRRVVIKIGNEKAYEAWFHCWSTNYPIAVVEKDDGTVEGIQCVSVRFVEPPNKPCLVVGVVNGFLYESSLERLKEFAERNKYDVLLLETEDHESYKSEEKEQECSGIIVKVLEEGSKHITDLSEVLQNRLKKWQMNEKFQRLNRISRNNRLLKIAEEEGYSIIDHDWTVLGRMRDITERLDWRCSWERAILYVDLDIERYTAFSWEQILEWTKKNNISNESSWLNTVREGFMLGVQIFELRPEKELFQDNHNHLKKK